ncbi:hypothetical protein [Rubricoccus marinus]|uniref:hypothetical protein n=1 Tax=Rubricoccus marinus TaxID=716817 RepID=UPI0015C6390B|nr:hypothetical protein [Rubricoccus marinus]
MRRAAARFDPPEASGVARRSLCLQRSSGLPKGRVAHARRSGRLRVPPEASGG